MTDNVKTLRMDTALAARLREQAARTGETDSEVIRNALEFYMSFEPEVFRWLSDLAEALRLPVGLVAEGVLARRMAELAAFEEVHGYPDPKPLTELPLTSRGLIRGPERFAMLKRHFAGQLAEGQAAQADRAAPTRENAELSETDKELIAEARELHHKKTGRKLKR